MSVKTFRESCEFHLGHLGLWRGREALLEEGAIIHVVKCDPPDLSGNPGINDKSSSEVKGAMDMLKMSSATRIHFATITSLDRPPEAHREMRENLRCAASCEPSREYALIISRK